MTSKTVALLRGMLRRTGDGPGPQVSELAVDEADNGGWRQTVAVFCHNRPAFVGAIVIVALVLFCFLGPVVYHSNQVLTDIGIANEGPSGAHPLGTNGVGYDELGRLMSGGQSTLVVALAVAVLATSFGALFGAVAGIVGGWVDGVLMRAVDAILAIPVLFLLLFLAALITPTEGVLVVIVAFTGWPTTARLVRSETLSLRTRVYVDAARSHGAGALWIILRHILPNVLGTVAVNGTFQVANAVLAVAYLGFLGMGIPPPAANWGEMLSDGVSFVFAGYWWEIVPVAVCLVLLVVSFNLVGDGLRDVAEVRLRER